MNAVDQIRELACYTQGEKYGELARRLEAILLLANEAARGISEACNQRDEAWRELRGGLEALENAGIECAITDLERLPNGIRKLVSYAEKRADALRWIRNETHDVDGFAFERIHSAAVAGLEDIEDDSPATRVAQYPNKSTDNTNGGPCPFEARTPLPIGKAPTCGKGNHTWGRDAEADLYGARCSKCGKRADWSDGELVVNGERPREGSSS